MANSVNSRLVQVLPWALVEDRLLRKLRCRLIQKPQSTKIYEDEQQSQKIDHLLKNMKISQTLGGFGCFRCTGMPGLTQTRERHFGEILTYLKNLFLPRRRLSLEAKERGD